MSGKEGGSVDQGAILASMNEASSKTSNPRAAASHGDGGMIGCENIISGSVSQGMEKMGGSLDFGVGGNIDHVGPIAAIGKENAMGNITRSVEGKGALGMAMQNAEGIGTASGYGDASMSKISPGPHLNAEAGHGLVGQGQSH